MNKAVLSSVIFLLVVLASASQIKRVNQEVFIWKIDNPARVGQYSTEVFGNPAIVRNQGKTGVAFNGIGDGLVIPKIPVEGWSAFTIEVLFNPAADGPVAPRFVHFQDSLSNRGTFEARITANGYWYMDTFLKNGKTNQGITLIDSTLLHKTNQWYWAAMVYDGKIMTSYVNGRKELEARFDLPAFTSGSIAFGVRLNKVGWFKGVISEARFHARPLNAEDLQAL